MKDLIDIQYWIFDLDNTLYSGQTQVFSEVDKKMSSFISDNNLWALSRTPSTSLIIINHLASIFYAIEPAAVSAFIL